MCDPDVQSSLQVRKPIWICRLIGCKFSKSFFLAEVTQFYDYCVRCGVRHD